MRLYLDGPQHWFKDLDRHNRVNHAADFMVLGTEKQRTKKLISGVKHPMTKRNKNIYLAAQSHSQIPAWHGQTLLKEPSGQTASTAAANSQLGDFELAVPEDMPQLIYQRLGKEFGIGQRDYVAQGVTSWRSYGRTPD